MFCKNCGKEIVDEAQVCPYCGVATNTNFVQQPVQQKNGMAVAGFVCSFLSPLLGWIFGGIGLARSKQRGGKGKGLSVAALIISTVNCVFSFWYNMQMMGAL